MTHYHALSNPDRRAILDHLAHTGQPASNRELSKVIKKSDGWTRYHLAVLAEAGFIVRTPSVNTDAFNATVLNTIQPNAAWPTPLTADQCRVLSVAERVTVMDYLAIVDRATVSDVVKAVGLSQGQVSKHLAALVRAGLVDRTRRASNSYWHSVREQRV